MADLLPFRAVPFTEGTTLDQLQQLARLYDGGLFVLPTIHSTFDQLRGVLQLGISLILEHSDLRAYTLSNEERDALVELGREKVYLKGYSALHAAIFLRRGASLLIDGRDTQLTTDAIRRLCTMNKTGMVKLVPYGFSPRQCADLLGRGCRMVFSCRHGQVDYPLHLLQSWADAGRENTWISASDFAPELLRDLLDRGASVVLAGDTQMNRPTFEIKLFNPTPPAQRKRLFILPRFGTPAKRQELQHIARDLGLTVLQPHSLFN